MPFGSLGLGLGLGSGKKVQFVPEIAPRITFGADSTNYFQLAWIGQPTSGDITTLVNGGYIEYTGTLTASYNASGYWQFVTHTGDTITIKKFPLLTRLRIRSENNATWNYSGPLPINLTMLYMNGNNINWSYSGPLPTNLTYLYMIGNNINWSYSGPLPTNLTELHMNGNNINWTDVTFNIGNGNITTFHLRNFRINKMTDTEMLTLLDSLTNRTGSLPSTISIGDYINYQNPPQSVLDAIDLLKTTKNITTVDLYA